MHFSSISSSCLPVEWDIAALSTAPATYPDTTVEQEGVTSLFFEGVPFEGRPTRIFAYLSVPQVSAGGTVPGMVLVHGGGGTAFAEWVRLWTSRGYAAIAMDLNGQLPLGTYDNWTRHAWAGPLGICTPGQGGMEQTTWPLTDQWGYHAVAAVIRAHSLLRAQPGVDATRIGLTGISWGGYTTCLTAAVDQRFRLAVPVYGCGFLGENSCWKPQLMAMEVERADYWLRHWDPSQYLPQVQAPMLWVTGTNDFAYPLDSLQKSYHLPPSPRSLCIRIEMPHGHGGLGENPEEIRLFADSLLRDDLALPRIVGQQVADQQVTLTYDASTPITAAELIFTRDTGAWLERKWQALPLEVPMENHAITAPLPEGTTVFYVNLIDNRGAVVSSEHTEIHSSI